MLVNETRAGKTIEKRVKIRIAYAVCLLILGLVAVYVGNFVTLASGNSDYSAGYYNGLGFGLIAATIITIIKNVRLLRNTEALKQREIYESDERNRLIGLKSWSYAGYAMFIMLYAAMIIAGTVNVVVMNTILVILGVFALCLFISRMIVQRSL